MADMIADHRTLFIPTGSPGRDPSGKGRFPFLTFVIRGTLLEAKLLRLWWFAAIGRAATFALAGVLAFATGVASLAAALSLAVILAFTRVLAFVGV
jgi:hypothetical protein